MGTKPVISAVTVSVDFGDKEYGNGSNSFMNISARYPEPGVQLEDLGDVIDQGLDMYFAAWETMLSARYATGILAGNDYKTYLEEATKRIAKARKHLRKPIDEQQ